MGYFSFYPEYDAYYNTYDSAYAPNMEDVYTIQSGVYNSDETIFLRCISLKDPNPRVVILREMENGGYHFISTLYVEE